MSDVASSIISGVDAGGCQFKDSFSLPGEIEDIGLIMAKYYFLPQGDQDNCRLIYNSEYIWK